MGLETITANASYCGCTKTSKINFITMVLVILDPTVPRVSLNIPWLGDNNIFFILDRILLPHHFRHRRLQSLVHTILKIPYEYPRFLKQCI